MRVALSLISIGFIVGTAFGIAAKPRVNVSYSDSDRAGLTQLIDHLLDD